MKLKKIVYVNVDGTVANSSQVATDANGLVSSIERSVSQFVDHQQQLLNVHEQYMQGPKDYARTFDAVLSTQETGELPESLDRTLGMYHEFQSETLRVHEQYLNNQTDNMSAMLSTAPVIDKSSTQHTLAKTIAPVAKTSVSTASSVVETPVRHQTQAPRSAPAQTASAAVAMAPVVDTVVALAVEVSPAIDLQQIQTVMMEVVAEKTGYPTEMLELEMDMEADLGIDSIKRVEILGSVQEIIADLPELNPEDLAELRTLGEIVDYMKSKAQAVAPSTPNCTYCRKCSCSCSGH